MLSHQLTPCNLKICRKSIQAKNTKEHKCWHVVKHVSHMVLKNFKNIQTPMLLQASTSEQHIWKAQHKQPNAGKFYGNSSAFVR